MDGIEKELAGQARVVRIDMWHTVGREIAGRYAIQAVPTIIVFDGQGQMVLRQVGRPNKDGVLRAVRETGSTN